MKRDNRHFRPERPGIEAASAGERPASVLILDFAPSLIVTRGSQFAPTARLSHGPDWRPTAECSRSKWSRSYDSRRLPPILNEVREMIQLLHGISCQGPPCVSFARLLRDFCDIQFDLQCPPNRTDHELGSLTGSRYRAVKGTKAADAGNGLCEWGMAG